LGSRARAARRPARRPERATPTDCRPKPLYCRRRPLNCRRRAPNAIEVGKVNGGRGRRTEATAPACWSMRPLASREQ
jgi:hypothetical protein